MSLAWEQTSENGAHEMTNNPSAKIIGNPATMSVSKVGPEAKF